MARPRSPREKARVTGQDVVNPGRYEGRSEPESPSLGEPSVWMSEHQCMAWEAFRKELPWLCESDRALLEVASTIRGNLIADGSIGVNQMTTLRQCLSQMGATPADRSKVTLPDAKEDNPNDKYFN